MRQFATANDGTGFEVAGDDGSAELYEDGKMVVSLGTFRECRETAVARLKERLDQGGWISLEWHTERD